MAQFVSISAARAGLRVALAAVLALGPAGSVSSQAVYPEEELEPAPEGAIEVILGGERRFVPMIPEDGEDLRENGVLPIRGGTVGVPDAPFEIRRTTLSSASSERLRSRLDALIRVYRERFGLVIEPQLAAQLRVLDPEEELGLDAAPALRTRYRHPAPDAMPEGRRAREAELMRRALHTSSHALISRYAPDLPFWLDEGLAVAVEGLSGDDGAVSAALIGERRTAARTIDPEQIGRDLPALMALDRASLDRANPGERARLQSQLGALTVFWLADARFVDRVADQLAGRGVGRPIASELDVERARSHRAWTAWRRSTLSVGLLAPPTTAASPAGADEGERVRRRTVTRSRVFRCVRGFRGTKPGRPVLFCTRQRR